MTFLKKLGQIFLEGLQLWTGFAPLVQASIPGSANVVATVSKDLTEIGNIVVQAEAMGQALGQTGQQKLAGAAAAATQIILNSAMLSGHQIANPQLFSQGVTDLTSAVAEILNSLSAASIQTTSAVVPGAPPMANAATTPTSTT